ncbi:MAG TPA: hypothetical protein DCM86_17340 [Verrucomicrobiales bacterium]|nr:hypothetical protein [Verrucomicrobiales bacterium]
MTLVQARRAATGLLITLLASATAAGAQIPPSASSTAEGYSLSGPMDFDRFSVAPAHAWRSAPGDATPWWQVRFETPRRVGSLLQVVGDHPFVLRNAASHYVWEGSRDGNDWIPLATSPAAGDARLFRIHRLPKALELSFLRFRVTSPNGPAVVLREVEIYPGTNDQVPFPDWVLAVNVTHDPALPGHGQEFIPLARECSPGLEAQQVWLDRFDPEFVEAEPRPLAAFLSGSFKDWCEVDRSLWRGVQRVLRQGRTPLWASCGGAQGLALVSEYGVDRPWDCPHCRDPRHPKTPLYGHIGHTASRPCGDYTGCVFERGEHEILSIGGADLAFAGLPARFRAMESHCGQIEWVPRGWRLIATAGAGTLTRVQCLRLGDRPVYAAQFHIEMAGTPAVSRQIMGNFLHLARTFREGRTPR